jgi:hypothetical protein
LVVLKASDEGIVLPVRAIVQDGSGTVEALAATTDDFQQAVRRARHAMVNDRFISGSQDVVLTADLSEASYSGASIALAAAVAMYGSRAEMSIDPYTAFTGDINLEDNRWHVTGVSGVAAKLRAAMAAGCRRAFIPSENEGDIPDDLRDVLDTVAVSSIIEIITWLRLPAVSPRAETLQLQKVRVVQKVCAERGWQLSEPSTIKDGCQFIISPPTPPELKLLLYKTGTHAPREHRQGELAELLQLLNCIDEVQTPLQTVQQVFNLKEQELREKIRKGLLHLGPADERSEQHCDYALFLEASPEQLVIKQYSSGKLNIQGRAGELYKRVLEVIVTLYNVHHPAENRAIPLATSSTCTQHSSATRC